RRRRKEVGENRTRDLLGERRVVQARIRGDTDERAFELAHVVGDVRRDERQHLGRDAVEVLRLGLLAEDGQPGLELRWLDVGDQAPFETGAQTVLERGDGLRRAVRRDDDLAAALV